MFDDTNERTHANLPCFWDSRSAVKDRSPIILRDGFSNSGFRFQTHSFVAICIDGNRHNSLAYWVHVWVGYFSLHPSCIMHHHDDLPVT